MYKNNASIYMHYYVQITVLSLPPPKKKPVPHSLNYDTAAISLSNSGMMYQLF